MSRAPLIRFILVLALALSLAHAAALPGRAQSPSSQTWLVRLRPALTPAEGRQALEREGLTVGDTLPQIRVWQVSVSVDMPIAATERTLARLVERGDAEWSEPNGVYHLAAITPDDTYYQAKQWNLRRMNLPDAWMLTTGDTTPIAIVDTGLDLDHPDLWRKIWRNTDEIAANGLDDDVNGFVDDLWGWDFVSSDATPQDDLGHGSHVAGIAGAETNNATGVAGVSWESTLMALKALDSGGNGDWLDVAAAVLYAADNGARVINLSLGGYAYSQAVAAAVEYAQSRGCLVVAATGNSYTQPSPVMYPAALPGVLAVANTDSTDHVYLSSNRGPEVDVAAPGVNIFSCGSTGSYYPNTGTSMATPHVSGLAALLWSLRPMDSAAQVTYMITSTAQDVDAPGWDRNTGYGRVDAGGAMLAFMQPQIALQAGRTEVFVRRDTAPLTATVTLDSGPPAPDGLTVSFDSDLGAITPAEGLTVGGVVTATFACTQYVGPAHIRAHLASTTSEPVTITVRGWETYFPFVRAPWSGILLLGTQAP